MQAVELVLDEIRAALPVEARGDRPRPNDVELARLNVRQSMQVLAARSYVLRRLAEEGKVRIVGCLHDSRSGMASFFDADGQPLKETAAPAVAPVR
jgi:carbonic anhydrase